MIARVYAIVVLTIFAILAFAYVYYRRFDNIVDSPYEVPPDSHPVEYTWAEFLKDCGGEVIVENSVHARSIFNRKYERNIVTWRGYFAEAKQQQSLPFFPSEHAYNVLVKMVPSESALYPDLVLSVASHQLPKLLKVIKSL